jgi:peptidoglycan-associated lipoprotein
MKTEMSPMKFDPRAAARLALIAALTASVAACASKPKPAYDTTPPPTQQPQNVSPPNQPVLPPPGPLGPVSQPSTAPYPGSVQDFVVNVGDRVYFDFDSYEIRSDARPVLDAQAAWLSRYPSVIVRLEGNADERGTREYNFALGARRSNAVREYLIARGVAASRIETVSYGKERPINPGSTEDAYAQNRNTHTAIIGGAR